MLMMLAFLIDQIQELCCSLFKAARGAAWTKRQFWQEMLVLTHHFLWESWEELYNTIIASRKKDYQPKAFPNTS